MTGTCSDCGCESSDLVRRQYYVGGRGYQLGALECRDGFACWRRWQRRVFGPQTKAA